MRIRLSSRSDPLVALLDLLSATAVAYLAFRLRFEGSPAVPPEFVRAYQVATGVVTLGWVLAAHAGGLYRRAALRAGTPNVEVAFGAAMSVGLGLLILGALAWAVHRGQFESVEAEGERILGGD